MLVRVLLFAGLRERVGAPAIDLEVDEDATMGGVVLRLRALHPQLGDLPFTTALNRCYVAPDVAVRAGDEVALIPPVSGG